MGNIGVKSIILFMLVLVPYIMLAQGSNSVTQTVTFGVSRPRLQPNDLLHTFLTAPERERTKVMGFWPSGRNGLTKITVTASLVQIKDDRMTRAPKIRSTEENVQAATMPIATRHDWEVQIDLRMVAAKNIGIRLGGLLPVFTVTD